MKVTIELLSGPHKQSPTKFDIQENIDALERAINGKPLCSDFVSLTDTKSILEAIQDKLPKHRMT